MRRKQRLKELTIRNNFMFGAVMIDEGSFNISEVYEGIRCRE